MHETAIVGGLMRILEQKAARNGVAHISSVLLKVGRLRAVEPQQLSACFEMFTEGTVADGAVLVIDVLEVEDAVVPVQRSSMCRTTVSNVQPVPAGT